MKYHGKASHASAYPWEGVNALDAAVLAYSNLSALRQQLKPEWKLHGEGKKLTAIFQFDWPAIERKLWVFIFQTHIFTMLSIHLYIYKYSVKSKKTLAAFLLRNAPKL